MSENHLKITKLKYLFATIFLWISNFLFADGSKDLYKNNASGGRAFLYSNTYTGSSGNTMGSWPFKSAGLHYAYVNSGEILHAASSAQGIGNGRIRLTAPNGSVYTSGNNTTGQISNRSAELAGPRLSGQAAGSNRYSTYSITAANNQTGIWKIEFLPTGDLNSSATPSVASTAANSTWTQGTNSQLIAAWDVSVEKSGAWIPGRTYSNVLNLHISAEQTNGFSGEIFALTRDGYIYRVNNNGNNGVGFTFFVNNKGFLAGQDPAYKSINYSNGIASVVHSPLSADTSQDITHKIFYSQPATDMPATSAGSVPGGSTWLKTPIAEPNVTNVRLVGAETTQGQVSSVKGGFVNFNAGIQGSYTITIESTANPLTFTTRTLTGPASLGENSIFWDGKDGNNNTLPPGNQPIRIKVMLRGAEVHFPYIDMEINPRGIVLELLNGADTSNERFRVYWNDSDITRTSTNNQGKAPTPINAEIIGSLSGPTGTGGHMWGQQNNNSNPLDATSLSNGYGNEKSIDTWSYIKGPESISESAVLIKIADLEITSITSDRKIVVLGENLTYNVTVKNNGPSDVENAKFSFIIPAGFDPQNFTFNSNTCGNQQSPLTYNSATHTYSSALNLPTGCEISYAITMKANNEASAGAINARAEILRPNDVTDPDATNNIPGIQPTNAEFECANNGIGGNCNNILIINSVTYHEGELCTEPVDGNTFQWSIDGSTDPFITQFITQPASNYGFVFDIYELDNSFNLNINGTLIASQELQFQSSGTSGINVMFQDGDRYEQDTMNDGNLADIWQMRGNMANPLIRIVINHAGEITLFGSKASYGPLFPLILTAGNQFNTINWNNTGTNNITVTQNVVGLTIMDGYGYGLNITPCACYNPAKIAGTAPETKVGITGLQRAGNNTQGSWPMSRKSGHLALESNTRGFVITRLSTIEIEGQNSPIFIEPQITNPQEGMMVYDTTAKCLKIYDGTSWNCFNKPACP